jgi:UDP-N-acetylglucosamine--N-acetylmuramyl-(pentapeptide) pyrophosphoryl-undecaprenol N-acetylglucosamine transferase
MHHYAAVDASQEAAYRKQLDLPGDAEMVLVTGGGLGAKRLNDGVLGCASELLERYPKLRLVIIAGREHEASLRQAYRQELSAADAERVIVRGFISNLHVYSGAADVIITRAGATTIAEFAAQGKACIVVPNPILTGGHQLKNAKVLEARKAIRVVRNDALADDPTVLMAPLTELLDSPEKREELGGRLSTFARTDAAERLAVLLLDVATR